MGKHEQGSDEKIPLKGKKLPGDEDRKVIRTEKHPQVGCAVRGMVLK